MMRDNIGGAEMLRLQILLCVFAGCLLMACCTDRKYCKVYNFVWWVGGVVGGLMLIEKNMISGVSRVETVSLFYLLVFGCLQELFFSKMYGRADCHAFLACAVVEAACGMGIKEYLIHMLAAFGILTLIQLFRCNIGRNGNLKQPVPFLPYITISFWGILYINMVY